MGLPFRRKKPHVPTGHPSVDRARHLATWMDTAFRIPILNKRIGLDPLLGMVPVGGDIAGLILSCYPLWVAYELGLPVHVLQRMAGNVVVDTLVGFVPVGGDIFDAFYKSNIRNVEMLEAAFREYGDVRASQRNSAGNPVIVDVMAE